MSAKPQTHLVLLQTVLLAIAAGLPAWADSRVTQTEPDWVSVHQQGEASVAWRPQDSQYPNGLLCATWMDVGNPIPSGWMEYGSSTQFGAPGTWVDRGILPPTAGGQPWYADPDIDYSKSDGQFYFVAMLRKQPNQEANMAITSSADCVSFLSAQPILPPLHGQDPDRPLLAIDNWPQSPTYGRLYVAYADLWNELWITWKDPGSPTWSTPVNPYPQPYDVLDGVQSPHPTVAPNGDLYVAWFRVDLPAELVDIEVSRKPAGSSAFSLLTPALQGGDMPDDPASPCGTAPIHIGLKGDILLVPEPHIEADHLGNLHVVLTQADPGNPNDHSNVYYRRSTNGGSSWEPLIRLNDDTGTADQFMPTLVVSKTGNVAVYWYDRREATDPVNPQFQVFYRRSAGNGAPSTWLANTPLSDVLSPPKPRAGITGCFMGHYNDGDADGSRLFMIWGDNRDLSPPPPPPQTAVYNPDVWFEMVVVPPPPANCPSVFTSCANVPGRSCKIGTSCNFINTGQQSCTLPDQSTFSCPAGQLVHTKNCPCVIKLQNTCCPEGECGFGECGSCETQPGKRELVCVQTQCGPCPTHYCTGEGVGCQFNGTCGAGGCCNFTCDVSIPSCTEPDPCPPSACSC